MAWITPITDRSTGARCDESDMNRIAGNLDWLATEAAQKQIYSGATISKTNYTNNDYVSVDDWENVLEVLNDLVDGLNVTIEGAADMSTTYTNFNTVESITLAIYNRYQLLLSQANANHYAGDSIYTEGGISPFVGGLVI